MFSWLNNGQFSEPEIRQLGAQEFYWIMRPNGETVIRYHLTVSDNVWHETGAYSYAGNGFYPFFEMRLVKKE